MLNKISIVEFLCFNSVHIGGRAKILAGWLSVLLDQMCEFWNGGTSSEIFVLVVCSDLKMVLVFEPVFRFTKFILDTFILEGS